MASYRTTVTRKGQITIPADIRRALAINEGDRVLVTLEDGQVRLIPAPGGSLVERTAGVMKGGGPALSAEDLRSAAEVAIAQDVMERMGG
jgi:AbrB family looped-hinge helix DNA binding protein